MATVCFKGAHVAQDKKAAASQRTRVLHVKRLGREVIWTSTKSFCTERPWCSKSDLEGRKVQSSGGKIIIVRSWSFRKQNPHLVPRAVMVSVGNVSP